MKEFKKLIHTKKILLVLGIVFCFISLSGYIGLNIYLKNENTIYLNEASREYASSYADVTLLTDYFATLNESGELARFYLVFDENDNIFVVTLSDDEFNNLREIYEYTYNAEIENQDSEIINGRTKIIPAEIKNYALDYLIEMDIDVNANTIDNVIGEFYLDTNITNDYILNQALFALIQANVPVDPVLKRHFSSK